MRALARMRLPEREAHRALYAKAAKMRKKMPIKAVAAPKAKPAMRQTGSSAVGRTFLSLISRSKVFR